LNPFMGNPRIWRVDFVSIHIFSLFNSESKLMVLLWLLTCVS
jgi:hypothetical protein